MKGQMLEPMVKILKAERLEDRRPNENAPA